MRKNILVTLMVAAIAGICVISSCSKSELNGEKVLENSPKNMNGDNKAKPVSSVESKSSEEARQELSDDELFSMEFPVAYYNGDLTDGEELELTFDKEIFLKVYEEELIKRTKKKWVAENVRVYVEKMSNGEIWTILQVSAYNVDEEKEENVFSVLSYSSVPVKIFCFCAASDIQVTCTASGKCTNEQGGCRLVYHDEWGKTCTQCKDPDCTRTETGDPVRKAICNSFYNIL